MMFKNLVNKHKNLFFTAIILFALFSVASLIKTFSSTTDDSSWDGVIARNFTSGTGTVDNPYIIGNASEFAYFKDLLEGEDATFYSSKNYVIDNSFNYGEYDLSINNTIPFSGSIDGLGNIISNGTITNSLFNSLEGATIKNLNFSNISYTLSNDTGAFLANSASNVNIDMLIINGNVIVSEDSSFGGFIFNSSNSNYTNIVLDYNIEGESLDIYKFAYTLEDDNCNNILIKKDNYDNTGIETDISFYNYEIVDNNISLIDLDNLDNFETDNYKININNNIFVINKEEIIEEQEEIIQNVKGGNRSVISNDTIVEHTSGRDGNTLYINDLLSDYNYMKGLNYTEVRGRSLPSQTSTGYYNDNYLVKVEIIYDGEDINNSSLVGNLSPINNENINKFIYYKYYALERNSNGTLATDTNGDNYIRIELIDNPFTKRPYDSQNQVEYGFNGWVCNQSTDTTAGLCDNATLSFDKTNYTRYMDIAVLGESEIIVHLNASWYVADVKTSANDISNFNDMSMQTTSYVTYTTETITGNAFWNATYYTMRANGSVSNRTYMNAGTYYKTSQNSTTYTYNSRRTRCNSTTCYLYTPVNTVITANSAYNGGSIEFLPNYVANSTQTATVINTYNSSYMYLVEDPNGNFTGQVQVPHYHSYLNVGDFASGFYYRVSNPTTAMINTGEYYSSNGSLCTSASSCTTAYKLIQYDDSTNNSNGNSISVIESVNGNVVDADRYYYLVTRDTNIFRYTGNSLTVSNIAVNKPFTVTGVSPTGNSVTGILNIGNSLTIQNDLAIENIKFTGATNSTTTEFNNLSNSAGNSIFANDKNLKIGRNVSSNNGATNMTANTIYGHTSNSTSYFKVIVESGHYSAYSGSSSTTSTFNESVILGNDYDRITNNQTNLVFKVGYIGATTSGNFVAGSASPFVVFATIKSGHFGYSYNNNNLTPTHELEAGAYVNGKRKYFTDPVGVKNEGAMINVIYGGSGFTGTATNNGVYVGMSAGTVNQIYGGSTQTAVGGNRIINIAGGSITGSVLGGSNSSSSSTGGEITATTIVYVGGTAVIGSTNNPLGGVDAGSVFGGGGGRSGGTSGSVYNSHVIINGGTIEGSVYGGGNFGGVGITNNATCQSLVEILNGDVLNGVYGGSKSSGFGYSANTALNSNIYVNMYGGTVSNVYGGSDTTGTVYGNVHVNVYGGSVTENVYGGGEGVATFVTRDVDVTIGDNNIMTTPSISGNVYGGSALGTVNSNATNGTATGDTTIIVNKGIITGSVFGGGEGNSSSTPYVLGDITVNINGGDMTNVFGGHDQAGIHTAQNEVHLNGGIVDNAYGGGNRSSVNNTHVYLSGSTVTNLYGGSNTLGNVTTANVNINSGTVQNVYGGNNEGGSCTTTNVIVTGTANVNGSVYGGGNEVDTTTTNITLNSVSGTIPNVYGGGNSASVNTTNITENGVSVTNMFGGSNSSGTVSESNIIYNSGTTTNVYGGNNEGGNTINSNIDFRTGIATNVYGGGNAANGGVSDITISNGTITNLFGGGNSAGLNESNIYIANGSFTNIYGGSNNSGLVSETNIIIDDTTNNVTSVYGGGNRASVGDINLEINDGTFTNIYGGGNLAESTGDVILDINGGTINNNIYGGGNYGIVDGETNVTLTDTTILGSAYAGGNGSTATVFGNTNITVDGNTIIGTNQSVPPHSGSVFGGGNQAYTGSSEDSVTSYVNIVGGTIYGNVYGGANTSVINGNTNVNIGYQALNGSELIKTDIYIKGHVFGGGEANASGSETYDWYFISVTEGTNIIVDGTSYNDLTISGSFYGGGNASSASGDSYLLIKNYGERNNPKRNVSIQRVSYATIDNSAILLKGAIDRANDYDTELFSISRVIDLKIKNNTELYLETGANLLEELESLDSSDNIASVTINEENNTLQRTVDNRIYMYEGKNLNIAKDQQVTDYGEVSGMTFLGIFNYDNDNNVNTGIYNSRYNPNDLLDWAGTFSRGSYVLGKHLTNHNIKVNGFYSNFINEETARNEVNYIEPTPADARFYMWFIGENVIEYNVNLVASKYSTLGSQEVSFLEFSKPNTSFQILSFDSSEIASGISLIDKNDIPRIASSDANANTKFGLSLEASNNGWLTTGKTSFYTREPSISGTTYYEGENSNVVPTMLFYLYHSKNITLTQDLGTVRISVMAITKLSALSNEIKRLVINVNMSTALFQTTEYEGAMTPGDKYELFASTANNITTKSKFSAYYALYGENTNLYQTGYHRVLSSSYILPIGTKITMVDFVEGGPEYYYHVIDSTDYNNALSEYNLEGECSYRLSLFTKMGSLSNNSNYDDAAKNAIYYNGTSSSEEFIFIVDFSDTTINQNQLDNSLLIEMRDRNEETIITVLGIEHSQLRYSLYANSDSVIDLDVDVSDNPLYIGYNDIFDTVIGYESVTLNGLSIIDTQYFDSKLGVQIYLKNAQGNVISGTDLTGTYFMVDNERYYPDIDGYTHIKLIDKVGNAEKWLIFNTDTSTLASGSYTFVIEAFASPDGIYYSSGSPTTIEIPITIISSVYGLNPILDDNSVIFSANNDKNLEFTINYTSLLENPSIRLSLYRRKYDEIYDTNYELVDLQDYIDQPLFSTNNLYEYLLIEDPYPTNDFVLLLKDELLTGTYRLVFRLYDNDTAIGEIIRYIVIK